MGPEVNKLKQNYETVEEIQTPGGYHVLGVLVLSFGVMMVLCLFKKKKELQASG